MTPATPTKDKKVILVIEDDQFLMKAYQVKFEKEGFRVMVVYDGKEALDMVEKVQPPDAVLLDLMLPSVSGFEVLSVIRKNNSWKDVPVIILTNLGQAEDMKRGKELGAQEYVVKANVRINDVIERVKRHL